MGKAVGSDLGTTFSCVSIWQGDRFEVISNDMEKLQVGCSIKQLSPDPFEHISNYKINNRGRRLDHIWISKEIKNNTNIKYTQTFEEKNGFIDGLSILDMIFNCGPKTKDYIKAGL